ncbi:MAG: AAA family ATPase [Lentisphaeria bacterium]|nr:AAA family ATPase [Lentisphaeria bacterium]
MSDPFITLKELEIRRFMGVEKPSDRMLFPPGSFSPGLTIVRGPNGSGKTTLAEAVRALIWPAAVKEKNAGLAGVFEYQGRALSPRFDGGVFSGDAGSAAFPPVPPSPKPYVLALQDLLVENDADLAAAIQEEMYGNVDLDGAVEALGLTVTPPSRKAAAKKLAAARKHRRNVASAQRRLILRAGDIAPLEKELEAIRAAREMARIWEGLDHVLELTAELDHLTARLEAFEQPESLARARGDDVERFAEWMGDLERAAAAARGLAEQVERAEKHCDQSGFTAATLPPERVLAEAVDVTAQWERRLDALETARDALARAEAGETSARGFIGGRGRFKGAEPPTLDDVSHLPPLFTAWRAARDTRDAMAAVETLNRSFLDEDSDTRQASRGVDILLDWLGETDQAPSAKVARMGEWAALVTACLGAVITLFTPLGLLSVPVALALFVWSVTRRGAPVSDADAVRENAREKYAALSGVPPIRDWTFREARETLRVLETSAAEQRDRERLLERIRLLENDRLAAEKHERNNRQALAEALAEKGIDCSPPPEDLVAVLTALATWREAVTRKAECQALVQERDERVAAARKHCVELVSPYADAPLETPAAVRAVINDVSQRRRAWLEADSQIKNCRARQEKLEADADVAREKMAALASRCFGVFDGRFDHALEELKRLAPVAEDYKKTLAEVNAAARAIDDAKRRLAVLPGWRPEFLSLARDQARAHLADCQEQVEQYDIKHKELVALEEEIRRGREGHDLERAVAEEREAERELSDLMDQTLDHAAGLALVDLVREKAGRLSSAVLRRARKIFGEVTAGGCELLVENHGGDVALSAMDTVAGEKRSLAELSSGTRVQLLLSVRLAFLEEQEGGGAAPPLILDEILANSDDQRALAVTEVVAHVVKSGRQVMYLTSQEDEEARWRRLAGTAPELDVRYLRLPMDRDHRVDTESLPPLPPALEIPPADGLSQSEYGDLLGVPAFPLSDSGCASAHVFYVTRSPRRLESILRTGCETIGQLRMMLKNGGDHFLTLAGLSDTDDFSKKVACRVFLLEKLQSLCAIGRGKPVTPDVVLCSESPVSQLKHARAVADLAVSVNGDGQRLIEALRNREVRGFQMKKTDELESWLEAEGYVDNRPRLPREDIILRVLAESAGMMAKAGVTVDEGRELFRRVLNRR